MFYRKLLTKSKFAQTCLRSTTVKIITRELNFMQHTNNLVVKNVSLPKIFSVNLYFIFAGKVYLFNRKNKNAAQITPFSFKSIDFRMVTMEAWSGCYVQNSIETSFSLTHAQT